MVYLHVANDEVLWLRYKKQSYIKHYFNLCIHGFMANAFVVTEVQLIKPGSENGV